MTKVSGGPLAGLRVVELAGIGPAPFCAMLLADLGADVVRVGEVLRAAGVVGELAVEVVEVLEAEAKGAAVNLGLAGCAPGGGGGGGDGAFKVGL